MKILYTIKIEAENKEEAMGLPIISNQMRDLFTAHCEKGTLMPADIRLLVVPGKFA
jgi:hypothetical protein